MKKTIFQKILTTTALCLTAVGLSSCTTVIDTGGSLDSIGKEGASHQLVTKKNSWGETPEKVPFSIYKRDSLYYVELPVVYIPAKISDKTFLILNVGVFIGRGDEFIYPAFETDLKEIQKYHISKETYYAVLTEKQFEIACKGWGKFEVPPINKEKFPILPASEVDLRGAQLVNQGVPSVDVEQIIESKMPCRRTPGNQLRRPLVFILDVVDIPLSLAAAPVGWISRLIYYSFE